MISLASIYHAFGLTTPSPPHCFQIERIGEILLPIKDEQDEAPTAKLIHIIPAQASLTTHHIETIIHACHSTDTPHGPDLFVSFDRAQNIRFHILSPSVRDESAAALQLLEKLTQHLDGADHV